MDMDQKKIDLLLEKKLRKYTGFNGMEFVHAIRYVKFEYNNFIQIFHVVFINKEEVTALLLESIYPKNIEMNCWSLYNWCCGHLKSIESDLSKGYL